jgi:hypothetical protein
MICVLVVIDGNQFWIVLVSFFNQMDLWLNLVCTGFTGLGFFVGFLYLFLLNVTGGIDCGFPYSL